MNGIFNSRTNFETAIEVMLDDPIEEKGDLTTKEQYNELTTEERNARVRKFLRWHTEDLLWETVDEFDINPQIFSDNDVKVIRERVAEQVILYPHKFVEMELAREILYHQTAYQL